MDRDLRPATAIPSPGSPGGMALPRFLVPAGIAALVAWNWYGTGLDPASLLGTDSRAQILAYAQKLFPPDLSPEFLRKVAYWSLETFAISFMGTLLSVGIALVLVFSGQPKPGLLGGALRNGGGRKADPPAPNRAVCCGEGPAQPPPDHPAHYLGLDLRLCRRSRAVPRRPGPGPLHGGVLGKLFAEVVEDIETQPLEALQATGATRLQVFVYGVLPRVLPQFLAYSLYRWEVNIREAIILGYVGAGGLGQQIQIAISLFLESKLLTLILAIYLMVTVVDYLSPFCDAACCDLELHFMPFTS